MPYIEFKPFPGLSAPDLQMIMAQYVPIGKPPHSVPMLFTLENGDKLCCEVSVPEGITPRTPTIVLIHGLGGSSTSGYMVRLARFLYKEGYRIVRVNLRGCGIGKGLVTKPYTGGTSGDIKSILEALKAQNPESPIYLIGYSLGGNIAIKLAGELGAKAADYIQYLVAICPTIDLYHSVQHIMKPRNWIYHRYYMWYLLQQSEEWVRGKSITSLLHYDEVITAPMWDFKDAMDYYAQSSGIQYLEKLGIPCDLLFAKDDPFIETSILDKLSIPQNVNIMISPHGGHMGFLGHPKQPHGFLWLTGFLSDLIEKRNGKVIAI